MKSGSTQPFPQPMMETIAAGMARDSGVTPTPAAPAAPASPSSPLTPPKYEEPANDPLRDLLMRQMENQQLEGIRERVQDATSRLMMQFGTRRAIGGGGGSPLMA